MSVYSTSGKILASSPSNVMIKDIKLEYPLYNDDQLLDVAIMLAKQTGNTSKIIWDGTNINFSGSVTHECKGFGGIDFNGSKIYMPNYDGGNILDVVPDESSDVTIPASDILSARTTNVGLFEKIFTMNTISDGNADMCLGYRYGDSSEIILYSVPVVKASSDGKYETGELFLTPESGNVICYNVHDFPSITFELCNGTVISATTENMSTLVRCSRSNVHIHNFVLNGRSNITTFHWGIFNCMNCVNIEIDHISGVNPVQKDKTSGYFLGLSSVGFAHIHDLMVGDSISWGAMGCRFLTESTFERCYLNRWDCHFAQFGINTIKDCVLNHVSYGLGNGMLDISNCLLTLANQSNEVEFVVRLRSDCIGVFDGDIVIKNCVFTSILQAANLMGVWFDGCENAKPSNSKVSGSPKRNRIIENCQFPDGCNVIVITGATASADMNMFENLSYKFKDCIINCADAVINALSAGQNIASAVIDGCFVEGDTIKSIVGNLRVQNSEVESITSDTTIPYLVAVGNIFSETQDVARFTKYAMYGNIAPDMSSVNKHSV